MFSSKLKTIFFTVSFLLSGLFSFTLYSFVPIPPPPPLDSLYCIVSQNGENGFNQLNSYFTAYTANQACTEIVSFDPKTGNETYTITLKNKIVIDNNSDIDSDSDGVNFVFDGAGSKVILDGTTLTLGAGECVIEIKSDLTTIQNIEIHSKKVKQTVCGTVFLSNVIIKADDDQNGDGEPDAPPAETVAAPTNLTLTAAAAKTVNGTFTDQANNEEGFHIERSKSPCDMTANFTRLNLSLGTSTGTGANVSFSDTTAEADTTYCYRVKAFKGTSESPPSTPMAVKTPKEVVQPPPPDQGSTTPPGPKSGNSDGVDGVPAVDLSSPSSSSGGCALFALNPSFSFQSLFVLLSLFSPLMIYRRLKK